MRRITLYISQLFFLFFVLVLSCNLFSQEERRIIREANKLYKQGEYAEAESKFNKAKEISPETLQLESNIGASKYRQGLFGGALSSFSNILELSDNNKEKADAFYNIGNTLLQAGEYDKSIQAYRSALRLDPEHDRSRYNMAVATKIKEQQQQQQQNQDDEQDDKEDHDQDQDQSQNQDDNQDKQEDQQQQDQSEMSREEMERFLQALENQERDLQEKLQKEKFKSEKRQIEKNW